MATPLNVLFVGGPVPDLITSPFGPFVAHACAGLDAVAGELQSQSHDAAMIDLPGGADVERLLQWRALGSVVSQCAVVVVAPEPRPELCVKLLECGVSDVLARGEASASQRARALRLAIERRRLDDAARRAYSIDLTTGLPNRNQLIEHMTHLLALREREPAAMALVVMQLEGARGVESALGAESANVLRRKVAVRLRSSLRASDVVAALGNDSFAVLLSWIDAEQDGDRVAQKLLQSLTAPFKIAGRDLPVGATFGVAQYPRHGSDAMGLLHRATAQAQSGGQGRVVGPGATAANDEAPSD